jgi:hypothetical protein
MKTLSILRVFFKLKKDELIKIYAHIWIPIILSIFLFLLSLLFYKNTTLLSYCIVFLCIWLLYFIFIVLFFIVLFFIMWGIEIFFRWIKTNWQKSTKIVNDNK